MQIERSAQRTGGSAFNITTMDFSHYYIIGGVTTTASADDVKKAYRKLAAKHHPDKKPRDKIGEERLKKLKKPTKIKRLLKKCHFASR